MEIENKAVKWKMVIEMMYAHVCVCVYSCQHMGNLSNPDLDSFTSKFNHLFPVLTA